MHLLKIAKTQAMSQRGERGREWCFKLLWVVWWGCGSCAACGAHCDVGFGLCALILKGKACFSATMRKQADLNILAESC